MSVFESRDTAGHTAEIGIDPPDFPVVVRGYERQRVDAYLKSVVSRLAAEHDRAEQAAASNQPPTFERLGAEAMKVLELAGQSAELLIAQAKQRGETLVQEAKGQAADLLEEARQQAERLHAAARGTLTEAADERDQILAEANDKGEELRTLAEDEARAMVEEARSASQRLWEELRDECTAMQVETERLQRLRDQTLEHLGHVRAGLNSLFVGLHEGEPDSPSLPDVADGSAAMADAGSESRESADAESPEPASAVHAESDQVGGSEARRPAKASGRSQS
jgi:F0F1-type ATP synthase membrane subunit b/b'